ncbi:50S ribosomal protein L13 [Nanobdella aerobiophila]|uniref:Large ribosomal subunit protein uL13 n=1 Tax=Nanobdella aerobiophila TaxID=2586965 RepID=A0A915SI42_9ARCH|nr:50S ribosomal protein L13 [Nanobdella aerobiophila]BBL45392.1 50S ribosomal protein L13 [Nanobdella aerobiophila]
MISLGRKYINAENHILGRLSSYVAKYLLEGYEVYIINSEKVIVTGKWKNLVQYWNHKINERGDWIKGPFYPKRSDKILRRVIAGMLPRNNRGSNALKRLKVYLGVPDELKNIKFEVIDDCIIYNRLNTGRIKEYYTLSAIARQVGGKL